MRSARPSLRRLAVLSRAELLGLAALIFAEIAFAGVSPTLPPPPGAEAQAYLDAIRKEGMSELAHNHLSLVSSVAERAMLLDFVKMGDVYLADWEDRFCGVPGAAQNPLVLAAAKGIAQLRPLADLDRSGFLSTEEASRFQQLFETGHGVLAVTAKEKTTDAVAVARFLRRSVSELAADYAEYPTLTARSPKLFPPLPALQGLPASRPAAWTGTELPAYVAAIERSGMSEKAHETLQGVAMIRTGTIQQSFAKDPETGIYAQINRRVEKDAARRATLAEPQVPELRHLADFDGSGFVTSEEAFRLYRLFTLGRKVAAVVEKEGTDGRIVAAAMGAKAGELQAELADYARQSAKVRGALLAPAPTLRF